MAMASHKDLFHLKDIKDEFHRIYPVFLECADQMEKPGKADGIWKLSV